MNAPNPRDAFEEEQPLDPAVEKVRRKMVRFFAINIGILMLALMAVLAAIVYKSTRETGDDAAAVNAAVPGEGGGFSSAPIVIGAGERVVSQSLDGGRVSLLIEAEDGRQTLLIADLASGRVVARIPVEKTR